MRASTVAPRRCATQSWTSGDRAERTVLRGRQDKCGPPATHPSNRLGVPCNRTRPGWHRCLPRLAISRILFLPRRLNRGTTPGPALGEATVQQRAFISRRSAISIKVEIENFDQKKVFV